MNEKTLLNSKLADEFYVSCTYPEISLISAFEAVIKNETGLTVSLELQYSDETDEGYIDIFEYAPPSRENEKLIKAGFDFESPYDCLRKLLLRVLGYSEGSYAGLWIKKGERGQVEIFMPYAVFVRWQESKMGTVTVEIIDIFKAIIEAFGGNKIDYIRGTVAVEKARELLVKFQGER